MKHTYNYLIQYEGNLDGKPPISHPFVVYEDHRTITDLAEAKEIAPIGKFLIQAHAEVFRVAMDRSKGN